MSNHHKCALLFKLIEKRSQDTETRDKKTYRGISKIGFKVIIIMLNYAFQKLIVTEL